MTNQNYHNILVPISIGVERKDGSDFNVQICQILIKNIDDRYETTGIFSLFFDNFGLDKNEFSGLTGKDNYELPDEKNSDYLGKILFDNDGHWIYEGNFLTITEQEQIAGFISTYEDGEVDY